MKPVYLLLSILSFLFGACTIAQEVSYDKASLPDFLPHVGKAISGRCYLASHSNKKIASVLMVSFEEEGFDVAPFDAERKREDFFDSLSYEQIIDQFPIIKKMFMTVSETAEGAMIDSERGSDEYHGEIKEDEKYFILRVYLNKKLVQICNYRK